MSDSFTPDAVANPISEFAYNPDDGITFSAYCRRYEGIFKRNCLHWINEKKVCLLLRKLFYTEHEKYVNFILTEKPIEINFNETVLILSKFFLRLKFVIQYTLAMF